MASFKVIVSFAVLAACVMIVHAAEEPLNVAPPQQADASKPNVPVAAVDEKDGHQRDKKFAIYPGYAYGYPGYIAPAIPPVSTYSFTYPKALPYAYSAAYYHPYPYIY